MQRTTHRPRLLTRPGVVALAAAVALTAGACAKSEDDASKDTQSPAATGAEQKVVTPKPGSKTCAIDAYGAEKLDLKNATVGFSQSEKEANPFRIAETQSIKDEAKKRGVKLLTANAQSQFSKQISDVQDLLAKGADLLVIAPLNSDGWDPVLQAAAAKKDEMGLGAVAALKGAGKKAGDVKIVTVDGTRNAVQGIVDGWISGVIESNPRFGPLAFQTLDTFTKGEEVPQDVIIQDSAYDADNAKTEIAKAY